MRGDWRGPMAEAEMKSEAHHMKLGVFLMAGLLLLSTGCRGDGGGKTVLSPTPDNFDRNLLTGIVLQPSDVPPNFEARGTFNPADAPAVAYNSVFQANGLRITSSAARYADQVALTTNLNTIGRELVALVGAEVPYSIAGSDAAHLYRGESPAAMAAIIVRDRYVLTIILQAIGPGADAATALDQDSLTRFAETMLPRLQKLIDDPSSITPAPIATARPAITATPTP